MCTSKCEGNCKNAMNNADHDVRESLDQINLALEKISNCMEKENNTYNICKDNSMIDINKLKAEARILLDEVNAHPGLIPRYTSANEGIYDAENIFIQISIKERVKQLRQKINSFEITMGNDTMLTKLNPSSF